MDAQPPAVVEEAPETDRDFRRWVHGKLTAIEKSQSFQNDQLKLLGQAMDLLLAERGLEMSDD
jgi:hypothetical protein